MPICLLPVYRDPVAPYTRKQSARPDRAERKQPWLGSRTEQAEFLYQLGRLPQIVPRDPDPWKQFPRSLQVCNDDRLCRQRILQRVSGVAQCRDLCTLSLKPQFYRHEFAEVAAQFSHRQKDAGIKQSRKQQQKPFVQRIIRDPVQKTNACPAQKRRKQHHTSEPTADQQKQQRSAHCRFFKAVCDQAQHSRRRQCAEYAGQARKHCSRGCIEPAEQCRKQCSHSFFRTVGQEICRCKQAQIQQGIQKEHLIRIYRHRITSLPPDYIHARVKKQVVIPCGTATCFCSVFRYSGLISFVSFVFVCIFPRRHGLSVERLFRSLNGFDPLFRLGAREQDFVSASETAQAKIHPTAQDLPLPTAAGMRFFHL